MSYVFGPFELDMERRLLRRSGTEVHVEPRVLDLLGYLAEHPDQVISKDELVREVWSGAFVGDGALKRAVLEARRALGDSGESQTYIRTAYGRGYLFRPEVGARSDRATPARRRRLAGWRAWTVAGLVALLGVAAALEVSGWRERLLGAAPANSVAVLPLENLSGDSAEQYLADGMTEALIAGLGAIGELDVIARTSVMQYRTRREPVPEIAAELGVGALIEGSVRRAEDRVSMSVRLISGSTGRVLWSQVYTRPFDDLIALQDELARTLAERMRVPLEPRASASRETPPVSPEAYDAFLVGLYHLRQPSPESAWKAIEGFDEAIALDPGFAPAHAGLADAYRGLGADFVLPPSEAFARSEAAALEALELDPALAEAHAALAFTRAHGDWDWPGAEASFRQALDLNPSYAFGHQAYGEFLVLMGRREEGLRELERAVELDPFGLWNQASLGAGLYYARQYDASVRQLGRVLEMRSGIPYVHMLLSLDYLAQSRYKEAIREAEEAVRLGGRLPLFLAFLGNGYACAGQEGRARAVLGELEELGRTRYVDPAAIGLLHAGLGEWEEAMEWVERSFEDRSDGWLYAGAAPFLDPMRDHPRFRALVRRMDFPD